MNYYIQGDAAKAEQIKAAFEKLGYDTTGWKFDVEGGFYYTHEGRIELASGKFLINLIKTHPDYKELELAIEPKFKAGDWIINKFRDICLITDIDLESGYYFCESNRFGNTDGDIDLTDKAFHLWTIADAKDGDVLMTTKIRNCPFIYRKTDNNDNLAYYYAGVDGNGDFCEDCLKRTLYHFGSVADITPATKEQRDLLFAKIKEAGYQWDADKKELRKIKPHYDIANFKPFDKVLVRYYSDENWKCGLFSHLSTYSGAKFVCVAATYVQCIPYNDDTKHLLGTTDQCDERFINW